MNFLSKFLSLFQPDRHIDQIQDQAEVKARYKYWRIRIMYSMFVGYAFYYFTRKSFTFAMPGMVEDFGLDKGQVGLLGSVFSIIYGLSKFGSGILSDRSNPRYFMAVGLILTGIVNIMFGLSNSMLMFLIFWGLNGYFQGFGWPACARFLTHWYSQSERGSWWALWNISHNVGAFLIPWIAGFLIQYFNWRCAMYFPGIVCILGGLFLINRLRDTPQSLGLPAIEKFRNDFPPSRALEVENERELSTREILFEHVLKNKYIWFLALAYFFVHIVRVGANDWTTLYLMERKGYSKIGASGVVSLFEVGGLFGSLFAGWISDKVFGAKRGPVNAIFTLGIIIFLLGFPLVPEGQVGLDSFFIFMIGFTVFGPQMLIGIAAAELSHKKAAATSTGFAGYFAYMGSAVAGYPLGKFTQDYGWDSYFVILAVCCGIALLFLAPLWGVTEARKEPKLEYAA